VIAFHDCFAPFVGNTKRDLSVGCCARALDTLPTDHRVGVDFDEIPVKWLLIGKVEHGYLILTDSAFDLGCEPSSQNLSFNLTEY
jgi:hypothetical protein